MRISIAPDNFNSILRVMDLRPEDSAIYTCIARNAFGQDKISTKLFVKGKLKRFASVRCIVYTMTDSLACCPRLPHNRTVQLKWSVEPRDVDISAGSSAHIACSADGLPEPRVEWTKVGDQGNQFIGSELRFGSVRPDDAGYYECRAKNGVEKDLVTRIKVNVLGK